MAEITGSKKHVEISPDKITQYAADHPEVWRNLIGTRINHIDFGYGKILRFDNQIPANISIQFDRKIFNKLVYSFTPLQFNSSRFGKLLISEDLYKNISEGNSSFERKQTSSEKSDTARELTKIPQQPVIRIGIKATQHSVEIEGSAGVIVPVTDAVLVGCPHCGRKIMRSVLEEHIQFTHSKTGNNQLIKQNAQTKNESGKNAASKRVFYLCPLCKAVVKSKNFEKHYKKAHPHLVIPANVEKTDTPDSTRSKRWHSSNKKTGNRNRGRASGGSIVQTSMKTIRIGRRSGAVIKRRSY